MINGVNFMDKMKVLLVKKTKHQSRVSGLIVFYNIGVVVFIVQPNIFLEDNTERENWEHHSLSLPSSKSQHGKVHRK